MKKSKLAREYKHGKVQMLLKELSELSRRLIYGDQHNQIVTATRSPPYTAINK
jgi:hypothetical protein